MPEDSDILDESVTIINEIEKQLEKALLKSKEDIEKDLEEKIRREKEEAEKRIAQVKRELEKEREALKDYKEIIGEFKSSRAAYQNQMKGHFNHAIQYQKEIEKLAGLTLEELRKASDLNQKLEELRHGAEERVSSLKKDLKEKFGIEAVVPEAKENEEVVVDLKQELAKLKRIKELLSSEETTNPKTEESSEGSENEMPSLGMRQENEFRYDLPGIDEVMETSLTNEAQPQENEPQIEERREEREVTRRESFKSAFEILEEYRKSDYTDNNKEISYFQNGNKVILDGESLFRAMSNILEEAKKLYLKLAETESPKEQFFIKQELINQQEIMRKFILRAVRMCEQGSCSFSTYTSEILNIHVLKQILEKLSMDNWSNQDDFISFDSYVKVLKDAFFRRITPPAIYLKSVVDELEI